MKINVTQITLLRWKCRTTQQYTVSSLTFEDHKFLIKELFQVTLLQFHQSETMLIFFFFFFEHLLMIGLKKIPVRFFTVNSRWQNKMPITSWRHLAQAQFSTSCFSSTLSSCKNELLFLYLAILSDALLPLGSPTRGWPQQKSLHFCLSRHSLLAFSTPPTLPVTHSCTPLPYLSIFQVVHLSCSDPQFCSDICPH